MFGHGRSYVYNPYESIGYGFSDVICRICEDKLSGVEKIMMDKELKPLFECYKEKDRKLPLYCFTPSKTVPVLVGEKYHLTYSK